MREEEEDRSQRARLWSPSVTLHAASLLVTFLALLVLARRQWFAQDEWEFISLRGVHDAPLSIWTPHNEHWSTIPILIYRALLQIFGLKSYTPYLAVLLLFHLFLAHMLWRIMKRAGVAWVVSAALLSTFLLHGAGAENLIWAFQIGFVGSVALGVLAVYLADFRGRNSRREIGAVVTAGFALMFATTSLPLVAVAGLVSWARRGWRAAAFQLGVPLAVFATWLAFAGRRGLEGTPFEARKLLLVPSYLWTGLTTTVERSAALAGSGAIILLVLGYWILRNTSRTNHLLVPSALALSSVLLFLVAAPGRVAFGVEQAQASRYLYIAWAMLIPALAAMLSEFVSGSLLRLGVVCVLAVAALVNGIDLLLTETDRQAPYWREMKGQIVAAARLAESGVLVFDDVQPEPRFASQLDMKTLRRLAEEGRLPRDRSRPQALLGAVAHVQLRLSGSPMLPYQSTSLPRVIRLERAVMTQEVGTCFVYRAEGPDPRVVIDAASPAAVKIRAPAGDTIRLRVDSKDGSGSLLTERVASFTPNTDVYLDVATVAHLVSVGLPSAESTEICGVTMR